ncbi:hypothetical protein [Modicisalibacter tunisiensis]|uniref:Uncharacterized protein n=1 Tax=Modicisalibacter tunisiensis TaxID=390637 RepID=A0ABS7WV55_9GAMM|nr:hypothetical protein [Modicisalibacter tunisiensis]KXS38010.1 MAG: hypothetical protein AWU55_1813 [Halomonadaceae bacterium T82-2]MBZ9566250.1 hypothetical protein [Modicisalibacter tunisiensis]
MSQPLVSRTGAILLLLASLVGLAFALYAYFTPLTGVNGTLGAMVAILACIVLAILAIGLAAVPGRGARIALRVLILLGLAGTFFAGLLLHQWWVAIAMVVGLVGLIIDMIRPPRTTRPTHA